MALRIRYKDIISGNAKIYIKRLKLLKTMKTDLHLTNNISYGNRKIRRLMKQMKRYMNKTFRLRNKYKKLIDEDDFECCCFDMDLYFILQSKIKTLLHY